MIDRILTALLAVAVVFCIAALGYRHGVDATDTRWQAKYNADLAAANLRAADAQASERTKEAQHAKEMAALDAKHTKELTDAKATSDRTIADLRAGAIRVRDRLTCPAPTGAGAVSQVGTSASVGDEGTAHGLQNTDAEFLLREAERADEVTIQLRACQGIVANDRKEQ